MHEAVARWLGEIGGWISLPEVSFAARGERGVIDIVAWHAASRSLLVIELKTRIVDVNTLMATMDIRRRVAWQIAKTWVGPSTVSIWVVVAPSRTNARILADHSTVLAGQVPGRRPSDASMDRRTQSTAIAGPQFPATSPRGRPTGAK